VSWRRPRAACNRRKARTFQLSAQVIDNRLRGISQRSTLLRQQGLQLRLQLQHTDAGFRLSQQSPQRLIRC